MWCSLILQSGTVTSGTGTMSTNISAGTRIPGGIVFGTAWRGEATARLAWTAFEAGFRAFDTANQPRHYNESALGEVIHKAARAGVPRKELWLQTKFTHPNGHELPNHLKSRNETAETLDTAAPYNVAVSTEEQVRESFRMSLEHLGTSYVDALLLHAPLGRGDRLATSDWQAWRAMENFALSGQARVLGVSNVNAAQLRALLDAKNASATSGHVIRVRPTLVQNRCWASRDWDAEVRSICSEHGLLYQGFSLLSSGVNGHVITGENARRLRQIAVAPGSNDAGPRSRQTAEQIVLQWALQVGIVPLVGPSQRAHMKEDVSIAKDVFEATTAAVCSHHVGSNQGTCSDASIRSPLVLFHETQLDDIQGIGNSFVEEDAVSRTLVSKDSKPSRQRQRQGQRHVLPVADKASSTRTSGAARKLRLMLVSDDEA